MHQNILKFFKCKTYFSFSLRKNELQHDIDSIYKEDYKKVL